MSERSRRSVYSQEEYFCKVSHRSSKISGSSIRKSLFVSTPNHKEKPERNFLFFVKVQSEFAPSEGQGRNKQDFRGTSPMAKQKRGKKKGRRKESKRQFNYLMNQRKSSFHSDYHSDEDRQCRTMQDPLSMLPKEVIGPPPEYPGFEKFFSEVVKSSEKKNINKFEYFYDPYNAGIPYDKYMSFKAGQPSNLSHKSRNPSKECKDLLEPCKMHSKETGKPPPPEINLHRKKSRCTENPTSKKTGAGSMPRLSLRLESRGTPVSG